jgi:hypothetical protein
MYGCDFKSIGKLSDMEVMSILVAACCHDFEHPGLNNTYLINSKAPWAIEYNDKSPLENHHIAASFMVMQEKQYDIFKNIEEDDYKDIRRNMIDIVLATDSAHHFNELAKFKSRLTSDDFDPSGNDKMTVVKMMVHLADISNPIKHFELALIWTGLLYDEFFKQGDKEVEDGKQISFLMNRKTENIAGSSVGFCKMLALPAYEALVQVIPKAEYCLENLHYNVIRWEELTEEFEKKKNEGKNYIPESRGKIKKLSADAMTTLSNALENTGTNIHSYRRTNLKDNEDSI